MKICLINVTAKGSTGNIAKMTARAAALAGNNCLFFFGREDLPENEIFESGGKLSFYKMEGTLPVLIHGAKARFLGKNGSGSRLATKNLVEKLKKEDPDIIQLHNLHGYYINLDILFSYLKSFKGKIFWTLHDCWSFTGGCAHFTESGCEKWKSGCGKCPATGVYPKTYRDRTREEFVHKRELFSDIPGLFIITPCKWLEDRVKESYLSGYDTCVIENGIDTEKWTSKDDNCDFSRDEIREILENKEKYILGVSSVWDKRKRPEIFGKTAEILEKYGYSAIAIGKAPGGMKDFTGKTEEKSKKDDQESAKTHKFIHIERTEDRELLKKLYKGAVCLVSTSCEDTFPTIGLESMACGTPVVYANICGCPEQVLGEPETGRVAKPDNPESFAKEVMEIEKNREFYSKNCIIRAKTRYDTSIMQEKYLKIWGLT